MMQLDLPTLMVMQSFALACAGMVLLAAWSQNRTIPALALWGIAHIIAAGGILSLMLGFTSQQPIWLGLGGGLLSFQSALVWKAARNLGCWTNDCGPCGRRPGHQGVRRVAVSGNGRRIYPGHYDDLMGRTEGPAGRS
jgi:hypothetical protein